MNHQELFADKGRRLKVLFKDKFWVKRMYALKALNFVWLGKQRMAEAYADLVAAMLEDSSLHVRWEAAELLGKMGEYAGSHSAAVAALVEDNYAAVYWTAVKSLGKMGMYGVAHAGAVASFLEKTSSWYERCISLESLGQMAETLAFRDGKVVLTSDTRAFSAAYAWLVAAHLEDETPVVRHKSVETLSMMDVRVAGMYTEAVAKHLQEERIKITAHKTLCRWYESYLEVMRKGSPQESARAVIPLGQIIMHLGLPAPTFEQPSPLSSAMALSQVARLSGLPTERRCLTRDVRGVKRKRVSDT